MDSDLKLSKYDSEGFGKRNIKRGKSFTSSRPKSGLNRSHIVQSKQENEEAKELIKEIED